ncbi:MAG TPA: hypothetical protein VFZ51_01860, partial [Woeseiaceae bacterium]
MWLSRGVREAIARQLPACCKLLLLFVLATGLPGCGFQLRSDPVVPTEMARTYISTNDRYSLFYRTFRTQLENAGALLVDSPVDATAEFVILADDTGQRVLS